MLYLYGIAYGIDAGRGSLHLVIYQDASLNAEFQPGSLCKAGIRSDTDSQYDHIGVKRGPVFKQYVHPAVFFLETFYSISEGQLYAVPFYLAVDKGSHIGVKRIH